MVRVLIVDDDEAKQSRVSRVLCDAIGQDNIALCSASTTADAATELEQNDFDLLVLDMNLPLRTGDPPRKDGGIRLLRSIIRGGPRLRRPQHIIGLTAYDDLVESFSAEFQSESWLLLKYLNDSVDWEDILAKRAIYISGAVEHGIKRQHYKTDLAIVTALKPIELDAVLNLSADWEATRIADDESFYYVGKFSDGERQLSVVCSAAMEMGMSAAACLTHKIINNFAPRYVAMAGIAAGLCGNFGDIIVADQSWDYGAGKVFSNESESLFRPGPSYIAIDAELKEKVQHFKQAKRASLNEIRDSWPGNVPDTILDVHVGPMASGAAVVESADAIDAIKAHNRKVIAIEMETYGVYIACRTSRVPHPKCFSAKSVCDFGTPPKTDEYQRYAAYTSASFIHRFALAQL